MAYKEKEQANGLIQITCFLAKLLKNNHEYPYLSSKQDLFYAPKGTGFFASWFSSEKPTL